MREKIKNIILDEFTKLINTIEADFTSNYSKKNYNFLLKQMDAQITASMVFVSSFESKSGFAIEACAKKIARLRYGEENVPSIVNPNNIKHSINPNTVNGQIIVTNVNVENGHLRGSIASYRASNVAKGRGRKRTESLVTQENTKETLLPLAEKYVDDKIHIKPVDLAFFDGTNWNIMELKAGGDLDSSNAPANIEKLLCIYVGLNVPNSRLYFATLYNKNGEGNTWTGAVKKHMSYPDMFLIGKNFWNRILPDGIDFEDFVEIYGDALDEIDLNKRINNMISDCIGE